VISQIINRDQEHNLFNILNQFGATEEEKQYFVNYFKDKTVSHHEVISELNKLRNK
jgi:hydroxymethylglutaryl-CoA reductase